MVLPQFQFDRQRNILTSVVEYRLASHLMNQILQQRNQELEPVQVPNLVGLPEVTRPDHIHSDRGKEVVREEKAKEIKRDGWVISIEDKLQQAQRDNETTSWEKLCIYRVPHYLQENGTKSYFPQTVSIGPYHHGKEHLRFMERHKWRAVNKVLTRTGQSIEVYVNAMRELEDKARASYEGHTIDLNSNQFTEMLVLDGCFVLELFRGTIKKFPKIGYAPSDPVFANRGLMHSIRRDMIMLENQLPLFVLDRLLELQTDQQTDKVAWLAVRFFDPLLPTRDNLEKLLYNFGHTGELLHCLNVFRLSLLWGLNSEDKQVVYKRQHELVHCVTELREAGVKFKTRQTDQIWDIRFENGCLQIPKLLIHDGTKSLFSNLIAFEQCHIDSSNHITSYIIFMDNLINSSQDVSHLHRCGIIEHWLGSDAEVADLFNQLCKEVRFDPKDSYLSGVSDQLNSYYSRTWNVLKATLAHKYFSNPWAYFSFFAAVILLILTLSQTFYTVYAYYKPPS